MLHECRSVTREQSTTSFQGAYSGQATQPASTPFHQRNSPPLAAQTVSGHVRRAISPLYHSAGRDDRHFRSQSDLPQGQIVQAIVQPIPRADPPRFMFLDIPRPCDQDHSISGTSGAAYARSASSGPVSRSTTQLGYSSLPKGGIVQSDTPQRIQQPSPELEFQRTDSPKSLDSLSDPSPSDRKRRPAQAASLPPSPPFPRQNEPRAEPLRSSPPSARIRDKSLPVREEDDEDDAYQRDTRQEKKRNRWTPGRSKDGRPAHRQEQHRAASPPSLPSITVTACYHSYPRSPYSRPGAPIPPSPYSYMSAQSLSPLISGRRNVDEPVLPPYSPTPHPESPWVYAGSDTGTINLSQMDPNVVREQLDVKMQVYALNNGGTVTNSTQSPSSTPFPGPQYNPRTFLQASDMFRGRRGGIPDEQASTRSSPSHLPVPIPPLSRRRRGLRHPERSQDLRQQPNIRQPRRVWSTQLRDTSPEFSSGEETVGEFQVGELQSQPQLSAPRPGRWNEIAEDEGETDADADDGKWIDEDIVGIVDVRDDLLQLEFHPSYIGDPEKRRRRWKLRWEALLREFHDLDRETNTALVLLAAPAHTGKLHSVTSRAFRRDSSLKSTGMKNIRSAFAEMAARQHAARPTSLLGQLSRSSGSGDARREDLRRALDTAISGLHALESLNEQREMRWVEEKHRFDEEKEKILLPLRQMLGIGVFGNRADRAP